MPKYLAKGTYNAEGTKGVLKDGGTKRRQVLEQAVQSLGGKLEVLYFAFGDTDIYAIVDLPDQISAVAASLIINASGAAKATYTVLITPEEVDEAAKRTMDYRPPGQ
jgi:uncharacterized protein with GYD domain